MPDAELPAFRAAIEELARSAEVINYVFSLAEDQDVGTRVLGLIRWLDASDATRGRVLEQLSRSIAAAIAFADEANSHLIAVDSLIHINIERAADRRWLDEEFDAFVSYKHRLHKGRARELHQALLARGLRSWFDEDALALNQAVPDSTLKAALREALELSRLTVFFETALELAIDDDAGVQRTAYSYQVFELRNARNLVYVRSRPQELEYQDGRPAHSWSSIDELADLIVTEVQSAVDVTPPQDPDLPAARGVLHELVADYVGRQVPIAPLAELSLLVPGQTDAHTLYYTQPLGADILLALLRLDADIALRIAQSGVDITTLFKAGARVTRGRWVAPSRGARLLDDAFGWERPGDDFLVGDVLDESGVLRGLIRGGHEKGYAVRRLIESLVHVQGDDPQTTADSVLGRLHAAASGRESGGRHGWLIVNDGGLPMTYPVSRCGPYDLALSAGSAKTSAEILVRLPTTMFPPASCDALATVLADGNDADFRDCLAEHTEIDFLRAEKMIRVTVVDASPRAHASSMWVSSPVQPLEHGTSGDTLRDAWSALSTDGITQVDNFLHGSVLEDASVKTGVLVAGPSENWRPQLADVESLTYLLARLFVYIKVRDMAYDDFPNASSAGLG